ncbi:hypothetical protein EKA14_26360 [Bacillus mycoides]|nr:hypothetical protein EKA14_26360 [Bacillus mycoides]
MKKNILGLLVIFLLIFMYMSLIGNEGKFSWFWCKNRIKNNKVHRFLMESYLMLQVQTIDG